MYFSGKELDKNALFYSGFSLDRFKCILTGRNWMKISELILLTIHKKTCRIRFSCLFCI